VFAFAYLVALAAAHSATASGLEAIRHSPEICLHKALGAAVKSSLGPTFQRVAASRLDRAGARGNCNLRPSIFGTRGPLYVLAILGFPIAVWLLQPGQQRICRYYFISAVALMLLASQAIGRGTRVLRIAATPRRSRGYWLPFSFLACPTTWNWSATRAAGLTARLRRLPRAIRGSQCPHWQERPEAVAGKSPRPNEATP